MAKVIEETKSAAIGCHKSKLKFEILHEPKWDKYKAGSNRKMEKWLDTRYLHFHLIDDLLFGIYVLTQVCRLFLQN